MSDYQPTLNSWKIRDNGNSEWGTINYRGIVGSFMDCDGDATEWKVYYADAPNRIVAGGRIENDEPYYHMHTAIAVIESIIYVLSGDGASSDPK